MKLFEALGGWVATVPELDVKMRLGTHCYKHAWHAELWHKRLPELREMNPDRLTKPANDGDGALRRRDDRARGPELTIEKLVGVYRVFIPHFIAAYTFHKNNTSQITDAPTIRSLNFILQDEHDDWREGEMLLQSLIETPDEVDRACAHQARLQKLMLEAGGIAGPGSIGMVAAGPLTATKTEATDAHVLPRRGAGPRRAVQQDHDERADGRRAHRRRPHRWRRRLAASRSATTTGSCRRGPTPAMPPAG